MILYNAKINTMEEDAVKNGSVYVKDKKIIKITDGSEKVKYTDEDIDCKGYDLYPGLIDAHTHLGMIEDGLGFEGDDSNEETEPVTPHLRAIDAVNPMDYCFTEAVNGGITTVLTGPGSANPVAGEIIAIKTVGRRIDDMIIKNVGMKFALGENPKTVYNDKSLTPITRMATAALIREALFKAKKYLRNIKDYNADQEIEEPEFDIKSAALVPLLKGEVKAFFHCHRADDIFTAMRIAKEFNLKYAIIHGTEGYIVADILGKEKVDVIAGPVLCDRCKPEMKKLNTKNAFELYKNHVRTALCTDHPVIPVQYLPICAGICVKEGLPFYEAMKMMTVSAAEISGISDRVGTITVGKDADFVLFGKNPLEVAASPLLVVSGGNIIVRNI